MTQPYNPQGGGWEVSAQPGPSPHGWGGPRPTKPKHRWWITTLVGVCTFVLGFGIGAIGGTSNSGPAAAGQSGLSQQNSTPLPSKTQVESSAAKSSSSDETPSQTADASAEPAPEEPSDPALEEPATEAKRVTKREWAKVVKDPDAYTGERYVVYGEVTQFDSATGKEALLADTAYKNTTDSGYFDGENTMLQGTSTILSDVVEDDVFKATVTVLGSSSYDTQIGGNTTVPHLQVDKIAVIGNNE